MNKIADIATLCLTVAGITVLVRPNSQGPAFVKAITGGFSGIIKSATSFSN